MNYENASSLNSDKGKPERFFHNGMTEEQVAERMDVPVDYVKACLEN